MKSPNLTALLLGNCCTDEELTNKKKTNIVKISINETRLSWLPPNRL